MITCEHCKTVNPPELRHCQKCHRDLLPGEGALTRLLILIVAGLLTAFGLWVLVRIIQGEPLPDLGCAFTSPVFWAILVVITPLSALKLALTPTPAHQKYLNRARRHLTLDPAQALADLNQALELALEPDRTAILKERARLHTSLGQSQQALRDKIATIESDGAYQGAEAVAALTGMDKDTFVGGLKNNELQALLKSQAAVPLGYCPKCKNVVELNEKMKCKLHRRARIENVRLAIPEDVSMIKTAILESQAKTTRFNRFRQLLLIVGAVMAVLGWAFVLKLGPFAQSPAEPSYSPAAETAEIALPAVAVQEPVQPAAQTLPVRTKRFSEYDFRFEIPADWLLITKNDQAKLLNGSLKGMDRNSIEYLGGAYTGGLDDCSGCAQIVIVILNEPAMQGSFSEAQFMTIKQNQEASLGERLLSYTYTHISEMPAAESQHIGLSGDTRLWEYIIVPPQPGLVYLFSMSSLKDEYPEFEPVFEQVAATLNIGPEPTPTPTPTPTPEPTSTPTPVALATVLGETLNIRSGPGQEHGILGRAAKGEELEVRGVTPAKDWYLIYTPELGEAWVMARLVSLSVRLEELPVITPP